MTKSGSKSLPSRLEFAKTKARVGRAALKIIGCDFHPSYQQIAMVDTATGELWEGRSNMNEAKLFYEALQGQEVPVVMEAVGNAQWFERMLASLRQELWIG